MSFEVDVIVKYVKGVEVFIVDIFFRVLLQLVLFEGEFLQLEIYQIIKNFLVFLIKF